ncbi:MAG: diphosphomevalonate decarboxylase [Acidobacteriota bacterium]
MKYTASAPSNIAFIKYWGALDLERVVPHHPSISMTLEQCRSTTTVEFRPGDEGESVIELRSDDGVLSPAPPAFTTRISAHLERLRSAAGAEGSFRVATHNSFPAAAGIASSASGFAALTLSTAGALGLPLDADESSRWARRSGSGSATRSVLGGYVQWPAPDWTPELSLSGTGDDEASNRAVQLATAEHWPLANCIALVETGPKEVSSLQGHNLTTTSPHFRRRLELMAPRLERCRRAIEGRDLEALIEVVEEDAVDLHLIAMSSQPPIYYWQPGTLAVMARVRELRKQGLGAFFTMDAGANVHVLCPLDQGAKVSAELAEVPGVHSVIEDRVGDGPRSEAQHLF